MSPFSASFVQDPAKPFQDDQLEREAIADNLGRIISARGGPFVLAIDSAWGTGKTTFVEMWRHSLANDGFPTLYYNAWENDFAEDPLISLISELRTLTEMGDLSSKGSEVLADQYNKVKKLGTTIIKRGLPIGARLLTAGILNIRSEDLSNAFGEFAESIVEDRIEDHYKQKSSIEEFKNELKTIARLSSQDDKPLVIFVDELDRCRPNFAVELLERIKHIMSVDNTVYVLSLHKSELAHSIKGLYGSGFDAHNYLGRFIDLDFTLPLPNRYTFVKSCIENDSEWGKELFGNQPSLDTLVRQMIALSDKLNISERDIQQIITRMAIVLALSEKPDEPTIFLTSFLLQLRKVRRPAYDEFVATRDPTYINSIIDDALDIPMLHNEASAHGFLKAGIIASTVDKSLVNVEFDRLEKEYNSLADGIGEAGSGSASDLYMAKVNRVVAERLSDLAYLAVREVMSRIIEDIELSTSFS